MLFLISNFLSIRWDFIRTRFRDIYRYCSYAVQMVCSYVLWPLAVVMGVNVADCRKVAEMIGTKTFLNEFVAYRQLSQLIGNREIMERHVTDNGTWYWRGDDVILTSSNGNNTVLTNGVITVK